MLIIQQAEKFLCHLHVHACGDRSSSTAEPVKEHVTNIQHAAIKGLKIEEPYDVT